MSDHDGVEQVITMAWRAQHKAKPKNHEISRGVDARCSSAPQRPAKSG
jgi:hypothetical protein